MIKELNTLLVNAFEESNYFNKVFGMAQLVENDNGSFPGVYKGAGEFDGIALDTSTPFAYWRITNDIASEIAPPRESLTACSSQDELLFSIPMMAVCFAKKDSISDCKGFEEYQFAEEVIKILTSVKPKTIGNVIEGMVTVRKIITDSKSLIDKEYKGREINGFNYEYAYIGIEFIVGMKVNTNCLGCQTS